MFWLGFLLILLILAAIINDLVVSQKRLNFLQNYVFIPDIKNRVAKHYPQLTAEEIDIIMLGLKRYFILILKYEQPITMPSRAVDTAWHEFLLFSKEYHYFCKKSFGRFLHHTPFSEINLLEKQPSTHDSWLERQRSNYDSWIFSCQYECINPELPQKLPLLFTVDKQLNIPDGFFYAVEDGTYPRVKTDLSPDHFIILIKTTDINNIVLAKSIKSRLFDDAYCKTHGGKILVQLFIVLQGSHELMAMVFDEQDPQQWLAYARNIPEPYSCIAGGDGGDGGSSSCGSCGGSSCGGCGGCGGCG
jgi:hypothetical protein